MDKNCINGLVLAGGNSSRMGADKAELIYTDQPQFLKVHALLSEFCKEVFISCKTDKQYEIPSIVDNPKYNNTGPAAGLLSAFDKMETPWLVLAIDYPFLQKTDIEILLNNRNDQCDATVYYNQSGFYEPLIGIYEKTFYKILKENYISGNYSLQKMLGLCQVKKVQSDNELSLTSIDTPEAFQQIRNQKK